MQPHFYSIASTVIITEIGHFCFQLPYIKWNSFRDTQFLQQKQLWFTLHINITLNKPNLNTRWCRGMVYWAFYVYHEYKFYHLPNNDCVYPIYL